MKILGFEWIIIMKSSKASGVFSGRRIRILSKYFKNVGLFFKVNN
jgi:hypothetical protein